MSPTFKPEEPQDDAHRSRAGALGTALLAFGAIVVCLAIAESSGGLPFSLPRSWYTNRSLWYLLALGSFAASWSLLRQSSPSEGGGGVRRFQRVVLYTRAGCHLCDEMRQVLDRYQHQLPEIETVDIDTDPELVARFTDCVPVLEIDGRIRFRGRINEVLLRRLIEAAPAAISADSSEQPDASGSPPAP